MDPHCPFEKQSMEFILQFARKGGKDIFARSEQPTSRSPVLNSSNELGVFFSKWSEDVKVTASGLVT
jgi:hypothetical protein